MIKDDEAAQAQASRRQPPYHLLLPILYAPVRGWAALSLRIRG